MSTGLGFNAGPGASAEARGESPATLPPGVAAARQQADRFWKRLAPRERQAVALMLLALAGLAIWLVLVQPALRTIAEAPVELDRLDGQFQQMQLAANEVQGLRAASPVSPEQATSALRAASERLGNAAKLTVQGDRATLTLTKVTTDALRDWLNEVRSAARARPVEAQLIRSADGYSGSIAVVIGAAS